MKNIVVLSGAGVSAESGIKTFRDADGLWEGHNVMEVASTIGWEQNKKVVLDFYNKRRKQLFTVLPNEAHKALAKLQNNYNVTIITQNVDDLHERAGSKHVLHLHGELLKVRSTKNPNLIYKWEKDLNMGDFCEENSQLRPHIVWFGETVPLFENAIKLTSKADILIIVGTSMQVYPAANLINYTKNNIPIYFIDPKPNIQKNYFSNLTVIAKKASVGVTKVVSLLIA
ncbi:Sir2 family NAD-dependent protein deacetylase [Lutibacter sp. B1]|uniref:SIR2 family NAD-dependent protein deacylase n=1 Tax=Lutibacter sp. B1 TaxID=2725996 RepID=UPI0014566AF1|nr:Sir2 family NAD-dependent protein deacetylase [Lutibacter sp. B1]NLP58124.1 NAD-dependent deacylase [Lutibacter sp. B1]